MSMLQPGDVLIDCTGASRCSAHPVPNAGAADGAANTFRLRLNTRSSSLPVQPVGWNRSPKSTRTSRTCTTSSIPRSTTSRPLHHRRDGIVNISAEDYERMPSLPTVSGFAAASLMSPSRWTASSPTSRRNQRRDVGDLEIILVPLIVSRPQCGQPAVAPSGRASALRPLAGPPCRRFGHGLAPTSSRSCWLRVRDVPGGTASQRAPPLMDMLDRYEAAPSSRGFRCTCAAR